MGLLFESNKLREMLDVRKQRITFAKSLITQQARPLIGADCRHNSNIHEATIYHEVSRTYVGRLITCEKDNCRRDLFRRA